jgi:hypothetical protein
MQRRVVAPGSSSALSTESLTLGAVIEPHDLRLTGLSALERGALGERIAAELEVRFGPLRGCLFEVHAGDKYFGMLATALKPTGRHFVDRCADLRL